MQDGHDPGLVGVSWRKVTTILKDVLLSAAAKSNFVKQVSFFIWEKRGIVSGSEIRGIPYFFFLDFYSIDNILLGNLELIK
jgi:hypothetical protein